MSDVGDLGDEFLADWREGTIVISTLCFGASQVPVRVRALTRRAARVEATQLPKVGTGVLLKRGGLEASGMVVWTSMTEAGISFHWPIDTATWFRRSRAQERNDDLVVSLSLFPGSQPPASPREDTVSLASIAAELGQLRLDLESLADSLAGDVILVATHPEIQLLDDAMQRLAKLMTSLLRLAAIR